MATSFTLDRAMQRKAMAKASEDGLSSLSSAIRLLLAAYVSGKITIGAMATADTLTIDKVEEIPLSPRGKKLAVQIFAAARKHAR